MSEPFVGEIRMFAGNFAPRGWAFCDGQLLPVEQYDALFSLLGTIYGGDGRTTFALPDLRCRVPIHSGGGPGLTQRNLGDKSGAEAVAITANQLPSHSHTLEASSDAADVNAPQGKVLSKPTGNFYVENPSVNMHPSTIGNVGASQGHNNTMPSLCVHFIIALFGIYPSRH
jgi:microcystin-dependent protein